MTKEVKPNTALNKEQTGQALNRKHNEILFWRTGSSVFQVGTPNSPPLWHDDMFI